MAGGPWTQLAPRSLQGLSESPGAGAALPELDASDLDDLFFLPPVDDELRGERDLWAKELVRSGTPLLLALQPGEEARVDGAWIVYDLLRPLLAGDVERLALVPSGATGVWPLVPGVADSPDLWHRGCAVLAEAGASCLQPVRVALTPEDRRHLAELGGEGAFDALFHAEAPAERELGRCAARHGLRVFPSRPETGYTPRQVRNRRLAAELALVGELWSRLDRPVAAGQDWLRAAREAEASHLDLAALARESNLQILDWLPEGGVEVLNEVVERDGSALLESLLAEYLDDAAV